MKKGFTLIEVIGILVVLTIVFGVTFPVVTGVINRSKQKAYDDQIDLIYSAAKSYALEMAVQDDYKVSIQTLKNSDYLINKDIIDSRTNEIMNGCVYVTFDETNNKYTTTYEESTCITGYAE